VDDLYLVKNNEMDFVIVHTSRTSDKLAKWTEYKEYSLTILGLRDIYERGEDMPAWQDGYHSKPGQILVDKNGIIRFFGTYDKQYLDLLLAEE